MSDTNMQLRTTSIRQWNDQLRDMMKRAEQQAITELENTLLGVMFELREVKSLVVEELDEALRNGRKFERLSHITDKLNRLLTEHTKANT